MDLAWMLKVGLELEGYYTVRTEEDPTRAAEVAREFSPDLILLDVMMPHTAGTDVAAK